MIKSKYNYDDLYKLYITDNLTLHQIADIYDSNYVYISKKLKSFNIVKSKDAIKKSSITSIQKKYGVDNISQLDFVKEKKKQTSLQHYGVYHVTQSEEVKEKIKETNLKKLGVEYPSQSRQVIAKRKKKSKNKKSKQDITKLSRLEMNRKHRPKQIWDILDDKNKLIDYIKINNLNSCNDIAHSLQVSLTKIERVINKFDLRGILKKSSSRYENEIKDFFNQYNITFTKNRKILDGQEIDLYNEDYKIGIEFNGLYWHSTNVKKDKYYHQKKSLLAESKGVFIYHIFEYEWVKNKEKILNQLINLFHLNKFKIYARECDIKTLNNDECKEFLNKYHLQGNIASSIKLGLFYNDELVQVMTFGRPRFNKKYEYELLRLCSKSNSTIVGGCEKLFKYFIRNYNPKSIISYCDIAKGKGLVYTRLKFNLLTINDPNYIYINNKYEIKTRYQCQKHKLHSFLINFDSSLTEKQNMLNNKYLQVFDSGTKTFIWSK